MLWIGERTRQPDGAHVGVLRRRPQPARGEARADGDRRDEAVELCERLNPDREPGRLTLIARMGAERVRDALPPLVRARPRRGASRRLGLRPDAREHRPHVQRRQDAPLRRRSCAELEGFFAACRAEGAWPGGVHLEFTGEDVTECLGGPDSVLEEQLAGIATRRCATRG